MIGQPSFRYVVNGAAVDHVSVADRGFQFGDGVFETIRVEAGRPRLWRRHLSRLATGLERLGIEFDGIGALEEEAHALCRQAERAVLKLIVTRGAGGRGYAPPQSTRPTRVAALHPFPQFPGRHWRDGVAVRWCRTPLATNPALAGIKHLNRLEQVLARREWGDPAVAEGLMLDSDGRVVEGTASNLFLVADGGLRTPALQRCGVAGVMRGLVIELASNAGLVVQEEDLGREDVARADEIFLTNSLIGIWPVVRVEDRRLKSGKVTRQLMKRIAEADA